MDFSLTHVNLNSKLHTKKYLFHSITSVMTGKMDQLKNWCEINSNVQESGLIMSFAIFQYCFFKHPTINTESPFCLLRDYININRLISGIWSKMTQKQFRNKFAIHNSIEFREYNMSFQNPCKFTVKTKIQNK